ncbi:MAG: hypothetical protein F6K39_48975, partial [Okeania sp. SIO3B3]|nr:hypothetical protein [Okeania sp. SIO3B3]
MTTIYLYCIIASSIDLDLSALETPDIYTLSQNGVTAVVRRSPVIDYQALEQRDMLLHLLRHQQVVEQVMQQTDAVLPIKFGTTLPTETNVQQLLTQYTDLFTSQLDQLAGCLQLEIVVTWDVATIFADIGQ